MQLKLKDQCAQADGFESAATCMAWSPDSQKLSVLRFDRQLAFYNQNCQKWDQVQTRGIDHTKPSKDYIPTCQSCSHDSVYIAVGQSDGVVYVFNVGKQLEKKAIQARFVIGSPVTSVCWLSNNETATQCDILCGTASGSMYVLNMSRKSTVPLCSYQCLAQLLQQKQVAVDGKVGAVGSPILWIHRVTPGRAVLVSEGGVAALYDTENPGLLRMVSRHQTTLTASALLMARGQQGKGFLVTCDLQNKVLLNSLETGQALTSVSVRQQGAPATFTAAASNPSGNGVLLASAGGLAYLQLSSMQPLVVQHDIQSSLELERPSGGAEVTVTCLAWRPDAACISVSFSDGSIDAVVPELGAFNYCGAEIANTAPNKSQLRLRGFATKNLGLSPGQLELTLKLSQELKQVRAFPRSLFAEAVRSADWTVAVERGCYLLGIGEKSLCVYSFEADVAQEVPYQLNQEQERIYFDVGVKRVLVISNVQLGEFTVIKLAKDQGGEPVVYTPVRNCSYATKALISCCPARGSDAGAVLVAHLGEDRSEFLITELSPPDEADDFTEPIAVLGRVKHSRIIDWLDFSPTGQCLLVRDVSGAILVYGMESKQLIDLSSTLGNGMVQWAAPFDVLAAQEAPDMPVLVYYNPTDVEDKAAVLQVPQDGAGWAFVGITGGGGHGKGQAQLFATVQREDGQKTINLALDQDLLLFNMLVQAKEVSGAAVLLSKSGSDNKNQWARLCQQALEQHQFMVCSRCYAALGDLGLARYARQIALRLKDKQQAFESDFQRQTYCDAQVCLLRGDLDGHDRLLAQCGRAREAVEIYRELRLYQRAEAVAPEQEREAIAAEALDWLVQTRQSTLAAQLKVRKGDYRGALELLMADRAYLAAYELSVKVLAQFSQNQPQNSLDFGQTSPLAPGVVQQLAGSLEQSQHFKEAAELWKLPPLQDKIKAVSLFRRGQRYAEAVALARQVQPSECQFIEKEWAEQLFNKGKYEQAVPHFIEARDNQKAVDSALRGGQFDVAERLLLETQVDGAMDLCLRLGEARYLQNSVDEAVQWFLRADQTLLAVAAFDSVGRFDDAVRCVQRHFPMANAAAVVLEEARRLIKADERRGRPGGGFGAPGGVSGNFGSSLAPAGLVPAGSTALAQNILQKMESLSSVHGVGAARDLLAAAGLYEQATELLMQYQLYDQLVAFAREHRTGNLEAVLRRVADFKKEKGDLRGAAQLLAELAVILAEKVKAAGQAGQNSSTAQTAAATASEACALFGRLNLFEDAMNLGRQAGLPDEIVSAALAWLRAQPNQLQLVTQQLLRHGGLDAAALAAVDADMLPTALQLAEQSPGRESLKKQVWERQGKVLEAQSRLQEAEHAYQMAGKPLESLCMYVNLQKWLEAEAVVANLPLGPSKERAIKQIKEGRAIALLNAGQLREAELIFVEMGEVDTMVRLYKERQMWQEALKLAKAAERRDLVIEIQEAFSDKDAARSVQNQQNGPAQPDISEQLARDQISRQLQQQTDALGADASFHQKLVFAAKQGGEAFLVFVLERAAQICAKSYTGDARDDDFTDDVSAQGSFAPDEPNLSRKVAALAVNYLTRGVDGNAIGVGQHPISPVISAAMNGEHLYEVCRAVLGLEYTETEYQAVLQQELSRDGLASRMKRLLLAYRTSLLNSQRGQQAYQADRTLAIPGDARLSRCFEALHLLSQSAQTLNYGDSPQQLKEKCQITVSLVRYSDLVPVDRCLAMAGEQCQRFHERLAHETNPALVATRKVCGGQAFVFLNRLMDIAELRPGETTGILDAADLRGSGIPWDVRVPKVQYLGAAGYERVRAYVVMQAAMEGDEGEQELPREKCPHGCGAERWLGAITCGKCKNTSPVCAITGHHVISAALKAPPAAPACAVCGCFARPAPWNSWVQKTKSCPVCGELGNPMGR